MSNRMLDNRWRPWDAHSRAAGREVNAVHLEKWRARYESLRSQQMPKRAVQNLVQTRLATIETLLNFRIYIPPWAQYLVFRFDIRMRTEFPWASAAAQVWLDLATVNAGTLCSFQLAGDESNAGDKAAVDGGIVDGYIQTDSDVWFKKGIIFPHPSSPAYPNGLQHFGEGTYKWQIRCRTNGNVEQTEIRTDAKAAPWSLVARADLPQMGDSSRAGNEFWNNYPPTV